MSEIKVHSVTWDYNEESDVTAVRIDVENTVTGVRAVAKGAAFCSPHDEPKMRVGIFEAAVDALRCARPEVLIAVLRHMVTEGEFGTYGNWEPEALDDCAHDRLIMASTLDQVGFKDIGGGAYMKVYPTGVTGAVAHLPCEGCE